MRQRIGRVRLVRTEPANPKTRIRIKVVWGVVVLALVVQSNKAWFKKFQRERDGILRVMKDQHDLQVSLQTLYHPYLVCEFSTTSLLLVLVASVQLSLSILLFFYQFS